MRYAITAASLLKLPNKLIMLTKVLLNMCTIIAGIIEPCFKVMCARNMPISVAERNCGRFPWEIPKKNAVAYMAKRWFALENVRSSIPLNRSSSVTGATMQVYIFSMTAPSVEVATPLESIRISMSYLPNTSFRPIIA